MSDVISWPTRRWMKPLLFSLIFLFSFHTLAEECKLKAPLYSLSGPVSTVLRELNLLRDPNLKGISLFNPIPQDEYLGPRFGGGLFLSRREDKIFGKDEVIYDQGRELNRYFKERKSLSQGIQTVGSTPREVVQFVLDILDSRLLGCNKKIELFKLRMKTLEKRKFLKTRKIIFFLGQIGMNLRYPETVYGQDGFILEMTRTRQIQTYPSPLHYIRWSQKVIQSLDKDFIFVGISEPKDQKQKIFQKIDDKHFNIIFPGALTPGLTQLELIEFIVENFKP